MRNSRWPFRTRSRPSGLDRTPAHVETSSRLCGTITLLLVKEGHNAWRERVGGCEAKDGSNHMAITMQSVDLHSKQEIEYFLHLPWTIYTTPGGQRDPH